ncbi:MAG: response regulator [Gemmatales bacterium]|nr:response regulator [Gemmatales bacterium]MDW7995463.1 response regulator [Gemmatales bacterium]
MATRILLVEDEQTLVEVLRYNLEREGFEVQSCGDGREALRLVQINPPDLIVLDLMLPNLDGLEVCRLLRADPSTARIPIVMLTARSEESDQLIGLAVGADDYVTKPFSVKVLIQRIRALLRRAGGEDATQVLAAHGIRLDRRTHRVTVNDQPVHLTLTEFRFLEAFLRQPGRVFRRDELLEAAGTDADLVLERTADVHIKSLRRKLGPAGEFIETVRGIGYRLREPDASSESSNLATVASSRRREK